MHATTWMTLERIMLSQRLRGYILYDYIYRTFSIIEMENRVVVVRSYIKNGGYGYKKAT